MTLPDQTVAFHEVFWGATADMSGKEGRLPNDLYFLTYETIFPVALFTG